MTQQTEYRISVTTRVNGQGVTERLITVRGDSIEETEALYRQLLARLPAWDAPLEARVTHGEAQETASNPKAVSQYHHRQNGCSDAPYCNAHSVAYLTSAGRPAEVKDEMRPTATPTAWPI